MTPFAPDRPIRWGIAGPGRVAELVASDLALVESSELVAVGSRSGERAEAFARRHGARRAYGSYADLVADPEVDVLYIATPHAQHHAVALAGLRAGKHLLVEKALTATVAGARELVSEAQARELFMMEAVWMRFHPLVARLRGLLADGVIGDVRAVRAEAGLIAPFDPDNRLFNPDLAGGVLLDGGIYLVSFAQMVLGTPRRVEALGSTFPTGVDAEVALLLGFDGGRSASLLATMRCGIPPVALIFGTDGWIEVRPPLMRPTSMVVHRRGELAEEMSLPIAGHGYVPELTEVVDCLRAGRRESVHMSLSDTLVVLESLETALASLGVRHREDSEVL